MPTKRQRALKEQEAMKAMRVLLRKYNLEEDADKMGRCARDLNDLACIDQEIVDFYKLKGTVAQYMDIVKQEKASKKDP